MVLNKLLIYFLFSLINICSFGSEESLYKVTKISNPIEINGIWNKEPWINIDPLYVSNKVGKKAEHQPEVKAKLAYDQEAIYVIFKVNDQYLKCITKEYQGSVYKDSCVEFFFTPAPDISKGYFNLEMNCIGTGLFKFHDTKDDRLVKIYKSDFNKIEVAHSIPSAVKKEIKSPITWTIEYRLPLKIIDKYFELDSLKSGAIWKANFYKIAAGTSNPHWLSWAKLPLPRPDFHRPEFFGTLEFN